MQTQRRPRMPIAKFTGVLSLSLMMLTAVEVAAFKAPDRGSSGDTCPQCNLYSDHQMSQSFESCKNLFPKDDPSPFRRFPIVWKLRELCSNEFAVVYSARSKTPLVVIERLTRFQLLQAEGEPRTNEFFPDPRLSVRERALISDYKDSGFDRGHMAPAADASDTKAMSQSFALTNMIPQDPENNRKIWSKVESQTRHYVRRTSGGNVYVFTGPIFTEPVQTIGANAVWVPASLYKLVYDEERKEAWAYVLPNSKHTRLSAPMSYKEFVDRVGFDFIGSYVKVKN